ncbi:acyl carrier protein [Streptomyces sp. NPDC014734]|uniref:acyl carrier protein n=1 Tax=Streptomyces sp. NPDC014734 TaxID=3364886 RepID=UPI0036FF41D1
MEEQVRAILGDPGVLGDAAADIAGDASLQLAGITSMQTVQILMEIEDRFGIEMPDSMLTHETFSTIDSIIAAVEVVCRQEGFTAEQGAEA